MRNKGHLKCTLKLLIMENVFLTSEISKGIDCALTIEEVVEENILSFLIPNLLSNRTFTKERNRTLTFNIDQCNKIIENNYLTFFLLAHTT